MLLTTCLEYCTMNSRGSILLVHSDRLDSGHALTPVSVHCDMYPANLLRNDQYLPCSGQPLRLSMFWLFVPMCERKHGGVSVLLNNLILRTVSLNGG